MAIVKQGLSLTKLQARLLRTQDQPGSAHHILRRAQIADDRPLPRGVRRGTIAMLPGIAIAASRTAAPAAVHPASRAAYTAPISSSISPFIASGFVVGA